MYLVAVGACYLDTILTYVPFHVIPIWRSYPSHAANAPSVPHYPTEDSKLRASSLVRRRGGNCPNTLEVLQQLLSHNNPSNVSLVLLAVLPARGSSGTEEIISSFSHSPSRTHGSSSQVGGPRQSDGSSKISSCTVGLSRCIYREDHNEPASSYIFKSTSTGSRTIVNYNALPEMTTQDFSAVAQELGEEAGWYHFEASLSIFPYKYSSSEERRTFLLLFHLPLGSLSFPALSSIQVLQNSSQG